MSENQGFKEFQNLNHCKEDFGRLFIIIIPPSELQDKMQNIGDP